MTALLEVLDVASGYGLGQVLDAVGLRVDSGEVVAVVGANGAGKTTLLRTIAGIVKPMRGRIVFSGQAISGMPAHQMAGLGLALVPEGGRLFPFMTVGENLELGAYAVASKTERQAAIAEMMTLFPILAERRQQMAGSLSGGERQMCAIARALMSRPRLLMLDEPSAGLSPLMLDRVLAMLRAVVKSHNVSVLLHQQHVEDALEMANRAYVIEGGRIVKTGTGEALLHDPDMQRAYMGL